MPSVKGESAIYGFPWPGDNDLPNGPLEFEELAKKVDAAKLLSQSLKPTVGLKESNAALTLNGSYQDVPNTSFSITPTVASVLLVVVAAFVKGATGVVSVTLNVDASLQAKSAIWSAGSTIPEVTCAQVYSVPLTAAAHTIKLQAVRTGEGGIVQAGTALMYALFAS